MVIRDDGPTPNGGDYMIGIYEDKNGFECEIEEATSISILEYTNDGRCVMHTHGLCEHDHEDSVA